MEPQDPITQFVDHCHRMGAEDLVFKLGYIPQDRIPASARTDDDLQGMSLSRETDWGMLELESSGDATTDHARYTLLSRMFKQGKNPLCYVVQTDIRNLSTHEQTRLVDREGRVTLKYRFSMRTLHPFMQIAQVMGASINFGTEKMQTSIRDQAVEAPEVLLTQTVPVGTSEEQRDATILWACFKKMDPSDLEDATGPAGGGGGGSVAPDAASAPVPRRPEGHGVGASSSSQAPAPGASSPRAHGDEEAGDGDAVVDDPVAAASSMFAQIG